MRVPDFWKCPSAGVLVECKLLVRGVGCAMLEPFGFGVDILMPAWTVAIGLSPQPPNPKP